MGMLLVHFKVEDVFEKGDIECLPFAVAAPCCAGGPPMSYSQRSGGYFVFAATAFKSQFIFINPATVPWFICLRFTLNHRPVALWIGHWRIHPSIVIWSHLLAFSLTQIGTALASVPWLAVLPLCLLLCADVLLAAVTIRLLQELFTVRNRMALSWRLIQRLAAGVDNLQISIKRCWQAMWLSYQRNVPVSLLWGTVLGLQCVSVADMALSLYMACTCLVLYRQCNNFAAAAVLLWHDFWLQFWAPWAEIGHAQVLSEDSGTAPHEGSVRRQRRRGGKWSRLARRMNARLLARRCHKPQRVRRQTRRRYRRDKHKSSPCPDFCEGCGARGNVNTALLQIDDGATRPALIGRRCTCHCLFNCAGMDPANATLVLGTRMSDAGQRVPRKTLFTAKLNSRLGGLRGGNGSDTEMPPGSPGLTCPVPKFLPNNLLTALFE